MIMTVALTTGRMTVGWSVNLNQTRQTSTSGGLHANGDEDGCWNCLNGWLLQDRAINAVVLLFYI